MIVSAYLDFAELQARSRRAMHMSDWIAKLDDFLHLSDRDILTHAGKTLHDDEYVPDSAVETKTTRYVSEPKSKDEMKDETVLARARAAALWCKRATDSAGGRPWEYLLILHDAIDESKTPAGLAAT